MSDFIGMLADLVPLLIITVGVAAQVAVIFVAIRMEKWWSGRVAKRNAARFAALAAHVPREVVTFVADEDIPPHAIVALDLETRRVRRVGPIPKTADPQPPSA